MSQETPEVIVLQFGLCGISKVLSDDIKATLIEEEKSFVSKSKHKRLQNFFSSPLQQQVLLSKHGEIPSIMF